MRNSCSELDLIEKFKENLPRVLSRSLALTSSTPSGKSVSSSEQEEHIVSSSVKNPDPGHQPEPVFGIQIQDLDH